MKKIQILLPMFFLLIPSLVVAQTSSSVNAAANRSWPKFWAEFRAAVSRRDKVVLKGMMSAPFNENCRIEGEGPPPDMPEQWLNRRKQQDWRNLQKLFALGTKSWKVSWNTSGRPQRVTKGAPENLQLFEYGIDGKWRWLGCACYEC
jgi:hypothetical protein